MTEAFNSVDESRLLREVAHRWVHVGWQEPQQTAFAELHHPEFQDHSASGRPPTREGFWEGVVELYRAFPDFFARVEDLIVEPEMGKVSIRWTATGTQRGEFLEGAPTNRQVQFEGIEIIRVQSGRIMERWGEWNGLDVLEQLRGGS
jgi:predicted ester cyclase